MPIPLSLLFHPFVGGNEMPRRLVLLGVMALAGCASSGGAGGIEGTSRRSVELTSATQEQIRVEMVTTGAGRVAIAATPDQVWAALPEVFTEMGLDQAGVLDEAGRIYGTQPASVRRRLAGVALSRLLDCGARAGIANADSYAVTIAIRTQVQPDGAGGSFLRTEVDAHGRATGTSDVSVRCGSTNVLERRIERLVKARIAGIGR
jgi:hypothetical protein